MNNEFTKGDIVKLKSGGPTMTVKEPTEDGELWCEWCDKEGKAQFRSFNPESLEYPGASGSPYAVG
jgi:uncharacterized protein YodC (DUF2158 family)